MAMRRAEGKPTRPDHWNNALSSAFPPVVNQSAGSCGSASRIYYMFSHEMNAARWADGSLPEDIYPTHFTWLLTWVSNQGKEVIAQHNGIPKTAANDAAGVTNMYYVADWGSSVDHALSIVGYDDRIEFDLDGNGVKGEKDKDEVGAWIIVNSWGSGWCNGGFIYCPYARATPTNSRTGFYQPEYYTPRRDYRPLRTLKVRMDYSHRSEMALYVGYSTNLSATKPEKETWLRHFYYSGLGKGVTVNASNPDPAIPMLNKWADGALHDEPMKFGYDLTDLVENVDPATPLKYFFRVETRTWARGEGHIYNASIIDYAVDPEGIETPFEIAEGGQLIQNKGKKTTITTVARAETMPAPRNLSIMDLNLGQDAAPSMELSWKEPIGNQYEVNSYRIYCNGKRQATVDGKTLSAEITEPGTYTLTAVYSVNGRDCESAPSEPAFLDDINPAKALNTVLQLAEGAQITIPRYNAENTNQFTIEFWVYPTELSTTGDNFGLKASSGKFFFKVNKNKRFEIGFDGGDYATSTKTLAAGKWQHIAIVANNGSLRVFQDGVSAINFTTGWSNTVGSMANLIMGLTEGTTTRYKETYATPWKGMVDELRIWNSALSLTQIKKNMKETFIYPGLSNGITHYYKMYTREEGNSTYLVDAKGSNDASITSPEQAVTHVLSDDAEQIPFEPIAATDFILPESISAGKALMIQSDCAPGTMIWGWIFTGADLPSASSCNPVITFTETGTQTVRLVTTNYSGSISEQEKTIQVNPVEAPQADFKISATEIAAGDHVSFINASTPLEDCTFQWTLEGADVQDVRTVNAAATYPSTGTYTVRLTATNAAGTSTVEKQIEVVKVAPQPAFDIQNNVAVVGEKIFLIDKSRYDPSSWTWTVSSETYNYVINGKSLSLVIDRPGSYTVSLRAANEKGANTLNRARAITVCAADGETGLKFDAEDDEVTLPSPFADSRMTRFTIEW